MNAPTVVKWISYSEAQGKEEFLGGMGGWFGKDEKGWDAGHRWKDYKESFKPEYHEALENLRASILQHGIKMTGEQHQQDDVEGVPLWSNGKVGAYTWRGWGDLMAAVWSEKENHNYSYMDFYM